MKKTPKGSYGYLNYKKKSSLIIMLASFTVIAAVFLAGYIATGTKNNIMTVIAAVLTLPAAKFTVAYIILVPHHTTPEDLYTSTNNNFYGLITYYDLVFSNSTSPIGTQVVVVSDSLVIALTDETKSDKKLFEKSVADFMEKDGHPVNVSLFTDKTSFIAKAKLMSSGNGPDSAPSTRIERNAKSILAMCL